MGRLCCGGRVYSPAAVAAADGRGRLRDEDDAPPERRDAADAPVLPAAAGAEE
jgi:hypothetical protein